MRVQHKDILWPDAGYRAAHAAQRAETLGGHYATMDCANVRPAPPLMGFRRVGGSRAGLAALGEAVESAEPWHWPDPAESVEWPAAEGDITLPVAVRTAAAGGATLIWREQGPVEIAGKGAPENPRSPCLWRGRHVCADGPMLRMSALGDTSDWDLLRCGQNPAAPVALVPAIAGRGPVAQDITALLPFRDRHLFVATADSLHCLYGDPAQSKLECLDDRVGILSDAAWCFDGESFWFLSRDGLYRRAGFGERHERISEAAAPGLLRDIDPATHDIYFAYSAWERGVYCGATPRDGSPGVHLFIDKDTGTMWPDEYADPSHEPVAAAVALFGSSGTAPPSFAAHPRAALQGRDGLWRVHDAAAPAPASRILLGPIRAAGNAGESAFAAEIETAFASQGATVALAVSSSDAPEALLPRSAPAVPVRTASCSLPAPAGGGPVRHPVFRPRTRGAWCTLRLSSAGPWSLDTLRLTSRSTGRLRP